MRPRFLFYASILLLVILAIIFWLRPVKQIVAPLPTQEAVQPGSNAPVIAHSASQNISSQPQPVLPASASSKRESDEEKAQRLVREFNESHYQPIEFYGQVIDQDSNPVPSVKINVSILQQQTSLPTTSGDFPLTNNLVRLEKETGIDGRFEITGEKGQGVDIESISKKGYEISSKSPNHFEPGISSFEKPAVFKMWKEGAKEPLVSGSHVFGIDSGKAYTLDLINGKIIEGETDGDLRVSITRPSEAKRRDKYQWSFSIDGVQGGLIESDDEFMYLAPESGYEPKFAMQFDPTNSTWKGEVAKQFYIRTRDGQAYGRIQMVVHSIYNVHSAIEINYAINPNGSRNLQP